MQVILKKEGEERQVNEAEIEWYWVAAGGGEGSDNLGQQGDHSVWVILYRF